MPATTPYVARMGSRLLGRPAADPRDVGTRLDRALARAARDASGRTPRQALPVQAVADVHADAAAYGAWRDAQLRRVHGGAIPVLEPGQWALVLWAVRPAALERWVAQCGRADLVGPPVVGRFAPHVPCDVGLAATLAAWLEAQHAVVLAPPLVGDGGPPYRLAALKRAWPQPVAGLVHRG